MATVSSARDTAASHPYTCNTCQVAFRTTDLQKGHMKSDWHRYNLKRRVASLPPISSDVFTEKVLQAREESSAQAGKAVFQKSCDVCERTYFSENSYQNHISSAKHRAREQALQRRGPQPDDTSSVMSSTFSLGEPTQTVPSVDSEAEEEFTEIAERLKKTALESQASDRSSPVKRPSNPHLSAAGQHKVAHPVSDSPTQRGSGASTPVPESSNVTTRAVTLDTCLFCSYNSPSLDLNVMHMERIHSMFIPERQYLVDMEGLISMLQEIVYEKHECLVCGKVKADPFAVQTHMRDSAHCKIPYFTEEEQLRIGDYYDFRSTYSDEDEDEEAGTGKSRAKLGGKRATKVTGENGETIEDDGWETDSSASSIDSAEITSLPMDQHIHQYERLNKSHHHSHSDPRHHLQKDGFHSHAHKHAHAVFHDDYELHLPTGKSVGHRSLAKYYRQNLHNHPSPEERAEMLALEAAERENAMDVDGDEAQDGEGTRGQSSRAMVSRANGGLGMVGVTEHKKKEVVKVEQKTRSAEDRAARRAQLSIGQRANNQKFYYYREG